MPDNGRGEPGTHRMVKPERAHFCEACGIALTDGDVLVEAFDVRHDLVKPRRTWFHDTCWVSDERHAWYERAPHINLSDD